jgi:hypothetical protein
VRRAIATAPGRASIDTGFVRSDSDCLKSSTGGEMSFVWGVPGQSVTLENWRGAVPIYEFARSGISRIEETTFSQVGLHERRDLQRLLREHIEVVAPGTMVISEEFGDWEDSRRRIDLLGIDKAANLVVIELKRTEDGGHMDLQSIRYAAMVSTMTFDQAIDVYRRYLKQSGKEDQGARAAILDFLEWEEPDDDRFAQDVRIILASAEFSRELTTSVLWLINHDIDIRCVRLKPYRLEERLLVDVEQIIPLPEAAEYQIQVQEKARKEREARSSGADFTRFDIAIDGEKFTSQWKRNAIFLICKHLCQEGVAPDDIAKLFDWRSGRVWYPVEGTVDAPQYLKLAHEKASLAGQNFHTGRWYCEQGELIHANGKTYAFSNQWGGESWHKAMNLLKERYPQFKIEFSPE